MNPGVLLAIALLGGAAVTDTEPAALCASRRPGASAEALVLMSVPHPHDTVVTATVCALLPARTTATRIGSYHGELYFDSTAASVLRVEKLPGGMRVENTTLAGRVNFAGAAPDGFAGGTLLHVTLRVRRPGTTPRVQLKLIELNATNGTSLMSRLVVNPPRT